ncbi:long-chain fatty acid--CoA ligase [Neolewinella aurantiaca]|uniref:Long-chain fatty acid--CoA ligase n=1 Tax=Neolewinella aurantiaca TaxID=2602767 RepID=A0A5C7FHF6_9BACT|nr:long-chain fatty acid--CoA ligase [Neolewinella aurantiaca]TXF89149.1 long-chain fatty acid--CoA ligase [Neolewinella aurantiaca]
MTATDWAARWAGYSPEAIAFTDGDTGEELTYGELNQGGMNLVVHFLSTLGLGHGDRIAILAENSLAYPLLFVAAQKAGFVLVPVNYRLSAHELAYILKDAAPALLIAEAQFSALAAAACQQSGLNPECWLLEEVFNHAVEATGAVPPLRRRAAGGEGEEPQRTSRQLGTPRWPTVSETDPIFILYTSGTTGFPKGALYTHRMLFWNSVNTALSLVINSESRTLNVMPPFHTGGWNVLVTPLLHRGGHTVLLRKFSAGGVLEWLEKSKSTVFMAVPTMLRMLTDDPAFATADLTSLRYIIVGGEPLPLPVIEQWHRRGIPIRQGFGMTEVGPNLFSLHQNDATRKIGSIGRPNFYVETRIVDENGRDCPANVSGELLLRGPMVTPGYWQNEAATQSAFQGEWFKTGDVVQRDEDGYFFVVGRLKEMYISGGENVYPAEIERWLEKHPEIAEVAVVGTEDEKWGEVGSAFVVPVPGHSPSAESLGGYCREGLARFKVPKYFLLVTELPKNATGKIDRRALANL